MCRKILNRPSLFALSVFLDPARKDSSVSNNHSLASSTCDCTVCFPQFGPRGKLAQHGFFRKSNDWKVDEQSMLDNGMPCQKMFAAVIIVVASSA